jgi:hypothetical protein
MWQIHCIKIFRLIKYDNNIINMIKFNLNINTYRKINSSYFKAIPNYY